MSSEQILSYIAIGLFILLFYPLLSLFMEHKDERQQQYFMTAVKIQAAFLVVVFGSIFIFLLTHGSYSLSVPVVAFLLDLLMIMTLIIYKMQLNPDGKFQGLVSAFPPTKNRKCLSSIKNVSIILTATFVFLNFKTSYIPAFYRDIFLLCAYLFFVLSCFLASVVSQTKHLNSK